MADVSIPELDPYEGEGPLPDDAQFIARNPAVGKDRRVSPARIRATIAAAVPAATVTVEQVYAFLQAGDGVSIVLDPASKKILISSTVAAAQVIKAPAAPTNGHVDNINKVFFFKPTAAYPSFSQYAVGGLPGVTGPATLDGVNSFVSGDLVGIHVNGPVPKGGLSVYVAGSGNIPDGKPLLSEADFTGVAVPTAGTTPTVTGFSPTSAAAGASVTISGTNFTGATGVLFNGAPASFTFLNATTITATVPTSATTGRLSVATPAGTGQSQVDFTVTTVVTPPASTAPTITNASPNPAAVGASVTLTGTNFTGATAVLFNGTAAAFTALNATTISATVPTGATSGKVAVANAGGTGYSLFDFTVQAATVPVTQLAAPTGLSPVALSSSSVGVSWNAVANATGYRLRQGGVVIYTGPNTSYTDMGLQASFTYTYDVQATYNGSGPYSASDYSGPAQATTRAPATGGSKAQPIIDGDSLDYGFLTSNPPATSWSGELLPLLDTAKFGGLVNAAVNGQSTADMLARQQQYVLAKIDTANFGLGIITVGGGHNDLMNGVSPAQVKANKIQYIQNIRAWQAAHGNFPVKIILESLTPNGKVYGSTSLADYETYRKQLNTEAFTGYQSIYGADYYQNYNSDSRLNNVQDGTFYNADKQHFTDAGQLARAQDNQPYFIAAQVGNALAPKADLAAIGSGGGAGTAPTATNLVAQPVTWVEGVNATISGSTVTDNIAAGGPNGFNAGAASRYAIGYVSGIGVMGYFECAIYHADGEFVTGFNSGINQGADYPEIFAAFHLNNSSSGPAGGGVRPFGTGTSSTGSNLDNFLSYTDGQLLRIVRETRQDGTYIIWYLNNKQVFITPNTDTGDFFLDLAMKGVGSKIRNAVLAAANPIDRAPASNNTLMPDPNFALGQWTGAGGATVSPNALTLNGFSYAYIDLSGFTPGTTYTVQVQLSAYTAGKVAVQADPQPALTPSMSATGTFTFSLVATQAAFRFYVGSGDGNPVQATVASITIN